MQVLDVERDKVIDIKEINIAFWAGDHIMKCVERLQQAHRASVANALDERAAQHNRRRSACRVPEGDGVNRVPKPVHEFTGRVEQLNVSAVHDAAWLACFKLTCTLQLAPHYGHALPELRALKGIGHEIDDDDDDDGKC